MCTGGVPREASPDTKANLCISRLQANQCMSESEISHHPRGGKGVSLLITDCGFSSSLLRAPSNASQHPAARKTIPACPFSLVRQNSFVSMPIYRGRQSERVSIGNHAPTAQDQQEINSYIKPVASGLDALNANWDPALVADVQDSLNEFSSKNEMIMALLFQSSRVQILPITRLESLMNFLSSSSSSLFSIALIRIS